MRKLAAAAAAVFAALTANAVLACEDHAQLAEQPQQKPAVAKKSAKQNKAKKAQKADKSEKTAVARADKS